MKKVAFVFALVFGFAAASVAQTAPVNGWNVQETDVQLKEGQNATRMNDGSIVRFNYQGGEILNLVVQAGRDRIVFDTNEEAPAGAPTGKCKAWQVQHCYYSTKNKMVICVCGALTAAPSADPTATKEHILLARQVGVPQ